MCIGSSASWLRSLELTDPIELGVFWYAPPRLLKQIKVGVMEFRIADTFTDSLARLTSDAQKAVKTTAFDLQVNPASAGSGR